MTMVEARSPFIGRLRRYRKRQPLWRLLRLARILVRDLTYRLA